MTAALAAMDAAPRPEVAARAAEPGEVARLASALISGAENRSWRVEATYARGSALTKVMVEDIGAPLTPTGRVARKASVDWRPVDSVVIRMLSPLGDRAVFVYENGSCVNAWVGTRALGAFVSVGYALARAFVLGPWEDSEMTYVPAWRRELIKDAKRLAKGSTCPECGRGVLAGWDNLDDVEQTAIVDAEPLEGPYALLTEIAAHLAGRGAFSAIKARGGVELHRRDHFAIGERRWPTHLEHPCSVPTTRRSPLS